ncbi:MAG: dihydroneopterin aldolase [Nitrospirae bacterium]|nr:dihydroneopterin aldolase [Nitrospirota bacterium]
MDKFIIKDIEFIGHCGITAEEQISGQRLSADIEVLYDFSKACISDRIEDTVNYVDLCNTIVSVGKSERYHLLEALAERICGEVLKIYNISEIILRIRKCSVPVEAIKGCFEVEIKRKRY